jgi:hypothetical protein
VASAPTIRDFAPQSMCAGRHSARAAIPRPPLGYTARMRWLAKYVGVVLLHKWAILVAGRDVNRAIAPTGLRVSLRRLVLH